MTGRTAYALERKDLPRLLIFGGFFTLWNVISWQFPFFWDTILNSRIAHWYIESGFSQLTVPEHLDAGHPPFFSLYLAGCWKLLGKTLTVAHLAMLPFLWTIVVQFYKLVKRYLPSEVHVFAMAFLLAEPTILAQSAMVTPDIALVAFYLLALNAVLSGNRRWLALWLIAMCMVTFRGILAVPSIFLIDVLHGWFGGRRKPDWLKAWPYVPATLLTLLWLYVHYKAVGWLFSPPPETYGGHREMVGIGGILRNIGLTGWRWLDHGRFVLWIFIGAGLAGIWLKRKAFPPELRHLLLFWLVPLTVYMALFVPFSNPIGHRYFMVAFLGFGLVGMYLLARISDFRRRMALGAFLLAALVSGHFWVYPDTIAKGWDASLAHTPYYKLSERMYAEILEKGYNDAGPICSDFPMLSDRKYTHVGPASIFLPIDKHEHGWENCSCVLQSNITNGFSDEELAELKAEEQWEKLADFSSGQVYMRLYRRK